MKILQYIILGMMFLLGGGGILQAKTMDEVLFAGGCFWCMESDFQDISGVGDVVSGYTGGQGEHPTYHDYVQKGHIEVVRVRYDPSVITFKSLLDIYWLHIDPTDPNGQFCDRGHAYSTAIFYHSSAQKELAEASKHELNKSGRLNKEVVTNILPAGIFYPAEDYHQEYYKKNPLRYKFYRFNCGRDKHLKELWGDDTMLDHSSNAASLKQVLTPLQYEVTQNSATEPPFHNEYWDNKKEGIYVDRISGEVLFSSLDKYRSGTGWPSFTQPLEPDNIVEKEDKGWLHTRTEIRSKRGNAHLGHVFNDGPEPTRLRYCMNSAALRFVAKNDLKKEGYQKYLNTFQKGQ